MPENVSPVGYNNIPIVSRLPVPLTSMRFPFDQIATAALELFAKQTNERTGSDPGGGVDADYLDARPELSQPAAN